MNENIETLLSKEFLGNTISAYLVAFGIVIGTIALFLILKFVLRKYFSKKRENVLVKIIGIFRLPLFIVIGLIAAFQYINIPEIFKRISSYVLIAVTTYYLFKAVFLVVDVISKIIVERRKKDEPSFDGSIMEMLTKFVKVILVLIAIILLLQNFGYNVSTLIAGLGISGIAVAFALQNVLADIFASFSIYFDKPFQVGDFIEVGNDMGYVRKIGIKTTRIQTLQGQELIISNKELTQTRIHNFKRMDERRVEFKFNVKYETPSEKLKKIPVLIKQIIEKIELADFERANFTSFAASGLEFVVIYMLKSANYGTFVDVQQQINLELKDALEKEGVSIAH